MEQASLVVLSAPSGCGKDTIARMVCEKDARIGVTVSATTRARRVREGTNEYEEDGVEYWFLSREEFEARVREGGFLEYAQVSGELYGTPRSEIERLRAKGCDVILLIIEELGAVQVKAAEPTVTSVFLLPPDAWEIKRRLLGRKSGESLKNVEERMDKGTQQMKMAYFYDYVVVNDDRERAAQQVANIIDAVRCRTMLHKPLIDRISATFEQYQQERAHKA